MTRYIKILIALIIVALIFAGVYASAIGLSSLPYGGGGEIGASLSMVQVEDQRWTPYGQHIWPNYDSYSDIDGDFNDINWDDESNKLSADPFAYVKPEPDDFGYPAIKLDIGYPYYLEEVADNIYQATDEAVIEKTYEKIYTVNNETIVYRYNLLNYGIDISIKTNADKIFKDGAWFFDYGYYFEDKPVDISVLLGFGLTPWIPTGLWNSSYSIIGGWAGIMQAQVYEQTHGLLSNPELDAELSELDGARYVVGHTITNLINERAALNMYLPDSEDYYQEIDFDNPSAVEGVVNAVNIEVSATLSAGATHTKDWLGHWDALVVQNTEVIYRIVVKLVTTLKMSLITEGDPIVTGEEGSTMGNSTPGIPIFDEAKIGWDEFWADMNEWFTSPQGMFYTVLILVIVVGVVYLFMKIMVRR